MKAKARALHEWVMAQPGDRGKLLRLGSHAVVGVLVTLLWWAVTQPVEWLLADVDHVSAYIGTAIVAGHYLLREAEDVVKGQDAAFGWLQFFWPMVFSLVTAWVLGG